MATTDATAARPAGPEATPYVGPRSFNTGEPLFGRDRELTELSYLLLAERIVLLHSPSGAGKTSLLQAGLIPRMREDFDVWRPTRVGLPLTPDLPQTANRYALSAMLGFEQGIPEDLRRAPSELAGLRLADYVKRRVREPGAPEHLFLLFDQFEEILTAGTHEFAAKRAFFDQLAELLQDLKVWALFALREDYLAPLAAHASVLPTRLRTRYRLDMLARGAAREAVVRPAPAGGRTWSEPAVDKLLDDLATIKTQGADGQLVETTGQYIEPMQLQVVCRSLWERMPADDLRIDPADVDAFGNVTDALARYYADTVRRVASADKRNERTIREWIGEALISVNGVRTPVLKTPGASSGLPNLFIVKLVDAHLVRADLRGGVTWFELAHDRLVGPVRVDNERWVRDSLHPMQVQAALWDRQDRPETLLLSEQALADAERWAAEQFAVVEPDRSFLAASREACTRARAFRDAQTKALQAAQELAASEKRAATRQRRLTWIVGTLGVVSLATSVASCWSYRNAADSNERALRSARMAELYRNVGDPTTQASVLREFADVADVAADAEWWRSIRDLRHRLTAKSVFAHDRRVVSAQISRDADAGQFIVTAADRSAWIWPVDRSPPRELPHPATVRQVALSPRTDRVLTVADDHVARLWPPGPGEPLALAGHRDAILAVAFSPDERLLATAARDGTARVWQLATGTSAELRGHADAVTSVAFSADNLRVVTGSLDRTARVWQPDGAPLATLLDRTLAHKDAVVAVSFLARDSDHVVTASDDRTAQLWRLDGSPPQKIVDHSDRLTAIAVAADGTRVATTSWDKTARLCPLPVVDGVRTTDPTRCAVLSGHTDIVTAAEFSPDDTRLLTASLDATARLWQTDLSRSDLSALPVVLGHADRVAAAHFSRGGQRIVTASWDRSARVWRPDGIDAPAVLAAHANRVNAAAFAPDGRRFITGSWDRTARVWDPDGTPHPLDTGAPNRAVAYAPTGDHVAASAKNGAVHLWRATQPATPAAALTAPGDVAADVVRFSATGQHLAAGLADGTIRVWRVEDRHELPALRAHTRGVLALAFANRADDLLVSAGEDGRARVWRLGEPNPLATHDHAAAIVSAAFSPDDTTIATSSRDADVHVWSVAGDRNLTLPRGHTATVHTVAFSPDGRRLVTASDDLTARLWSTTGGPAIPLEPHGAEVLAAWFQDDTRVITVAADNVVRLWPADGRSEPEILAGPKEWITSAAYSNPAGRLLTASSAGSVYLWTLFSRDDYADHLWRATSYCLPVALRKDRLGESDAVARASYQRCRDRVAEYAKRGAY